MVMVTGDAHEERAGRTNRLDLGDPIKYGKWHSLKSEVAKSKQKVFLGFQVLLQFF